MPRGRPPPSAVTPQAAASNDDGQPQHDDNAAVAAVAAASDDVRHTTRVSRAFGEKPTPRRFSMPPFARRREAHAFTLVEVLIIDITRDDIDAAHTLTPPAGT